MFECTREPIAFLLALGILLGACSAESPSTYQGYVEGEFVHIASPLAGRLEQLLVQRGQAVNAKTLLFTLEAEQEQAAKRQSQEQLNASTAQLADVSRGQRDPEREVVSAQLVQAKAAERQSASQLKRDQVQIEIGGFPKPGRRFAGASRDRCGASARVGEPPTSVQPACAR